MKRSISTSSASDAASDSSACDSPTPPTAFWPQRTAMTFYPPQLSVPPATPNVLTPAWATHVSPINANSPINAVSLPSPVPMTVPMFTWGDFDSATFIHSIDAAYAKVVHWRKNTFTVPYGNAGKRFVSELSRLFRAYADSSALECVAMRAITVMSILFYSCRNHFANPNPSTIYHI